MTYSNEAMAKLVEPNRVHRSVYTDPEIFKLEMERIWGRSWIYVGHESQIKQPGEYLTTTIGSEPVVLVRDKENAIHVLYNRCGHKGTKVAGKPCGKTSVFRCPYHGWTYRLDGKLLLTPHKIAYENTGIDLADPQFSLRQVARVDSHRGFVFASLAASGPDFREFLQDTIATIDNMVDRSPQGEVEIAGACLPYLHDCNWKMFVENLNDAVHPMVAHASVGKAARQLLHSMPEGSAYPPEAEIIFPFGSAYELFDRMKVTALLYGHSYMGGEESIHSAYSDIPGYMESLVAGHGEEKARAVLSQNRHNTTVYPSFTIKDAVQVIRVARPIAVDKTLIQSWHFRLKGAPDQLLHRTITYSRLINSPASMIGPDDWDVYARMQESLQSGAAEWVDMHRYLGQDESVSERSGMSRAPGTSDLSVRNQYRAWLQYMTGKALA
jgi:phenylpropionate dioxygenase-like ring-hydroxylating dioxygenase large terminal subunit